MASIFSQIVAGKIPAYKIAETDEFLAFLDVFPIAKGHVLVIPKQEVDNLFDLEDEAHQGLWLFAKQVAKAMKPCFDCKKIGVAVVGLEVPHAHIHLIPINAVGDMDFKQEKLSFSEEEMTSICQSIQNEFNKA